MTILLPGAALFFIVGTALPLLSYDYWMVRLFDFPRVQMTIGITATLGTYAWVGTTFPIEYALMGLLGLCLIYQVDRILLYTPLAPTQVQQVEDQDEDEQLSVLVANVEVDNRDADPLHALIEDTEPDLILALETDEWWAEQLRPLADTYPHTVECPQENSYGMMLFSRRPLVDTNIRYMVEDNIPSIHAKVELPSGRRTYLHGMHPRPPHPTHDPDTTERDAELLLLAREIRDRAAPTIVVGDLNDVSWSYTTRLLQKISGLLDPRIGRGVYNTFHARYPLLRYPLDHAFHSEHFKLVQLSVLPYIGSDHFPVLIELQYDPGAPDDHVEPQAEEWEEQQAKHELNKLEAKRTTE